MDNPLRRHTMLRLRTGVGRHGQINHISPARAINPQINLSDHRLGTIRDLVCILIPVKITSWSITRWRSIP